MEDTLLMHMETPGSPYYRDKRTFSILSTARDSTQLVLSFYAIAENASTNSGMQYVYTTKEYWYEYKEKKRCFQTNWGGYVQLSDTNFTIYPDKASPPIPLMYGCIGDDFKGQGPIFPYALTARDGEMRVKATQSDWDCYYEITLAVIDGEVKSIGSEEGDCDYDY